MPGGPPYLFSIAKKKRKQKFFQPVRCIDFIRRKKNYPSILIILMLKYSIIKLAQLYHNTELMNRLHTKRSKHNQNTQSFTNKNEYEHIKWHL